MKDVIKREIIDPYGFIYITTNLVNGKRYLGQRTFTQGWQNYLGSGTAFKRALKKYGEENFHKDIIYICYSQEELNQVEYELSVFLDVVESDNFYNLVYGGGTSRGWHQSQETRDKIGQKAKDRLLDPKNHPMYGKSGLAGEKNPMFGVSPKERMDEEKYQQWYEKHIPYWESYSSKLKGKHMWGDGPNPNIGKHLSDEQKEFLSQNAKNRFKNPENHPMYGKHHSEESLRKMSEAKKNKTPMHLCIPVYCIELHQCFYASAAVESTLHICALGVSKCCRGIQKSAGKHPETGEKLHWLYTDDAIKQGYITQQELDDYLNNLRLKGE